MILNCSGVEFIRKLSELVDRVGDSLGSQSSASGKLVLTQADSLEIACKQIFAGGCTIYSKNFAVFESRFGDRDLFEGDDAVDNLIAALKPLHPSMAYVVLFWPSGEECDYDPSVDGGSYSICLFIDAIQQANTNILIYFARYED